MHEQCPKYQKQTPNEDMVRRPVSAVRFGIIRVLVRGEEVEEAIEEAASDEDNEECRIFHFENLLFLGVHCEEGAAPHERSTEVSKNVEEYKEDGF